MVALARWQRTDVLKPPIRSDSPVGQPRNEGTLKAWNDQLGAGFIANHDGQEVVVHRTAFPDDGYLPTTGEVLTFEVEPDDHGKPSAVRVQRFADPAPEVAKAGGKGRKLRLSKAPRHASSPTSKIGQKIAVLVLIVLLAVVAYSRYAKRVGQIEAAAHKTLR